MTETKVVDIQWPKTPGMDRINIMRPGPWGNPFRIGMDGLRDEVIAKHKAWLKNEIRAGRVSLEALAELDGKELACICAPKPCHGDNLKAGAKWAKEELAKRKAQLPSGTGEPEKKPDGGSVASRPTKAASAVSKSSASTKRKAKR